MKMEILEEAFFSYRRRTGGYGIANVKLMENFKQEIKAKDLFNEDMILLGIPLDNPQEIPADEQRYDVGILTKEKRIEGLETRKLEKGRYGIFEVPHTFDGVTDFWKQVGNLGEQLPIDYQKPIVERYTLELVRNHRCEFCVPLAD